MGFLALMTFYVYILQSRVDGSFYIGYSNEPERRLAEHNAGLSKYTSKKLPWEIVYTELCESKSAAIKRERFLKGQRNRDFYLKLINGGQNSWLSSRVLGTGSSPVRTAETKLILIGWAFLLLGYSRSISNALE